MEEIQTPLKNLKNYFNDREKLKRPILINLKTDMSAQYQGEDMKNIRKRTDGRYEWRKQIDNIKHQIIDKNKKELERKVREFIKLNKQKKYEEHKSCTFFELADYWYNTYKKNLKSGILYKYYINARFSNNIFKQKIENITYEQLENFIKSINEHRVASYCYFIITGVYKEALKRDMIKKDISQLITKPKNKTEIGEWFTIKEQNLILNNLDKTPIKYEILFYLLTGARRDEAINVKYEDINFEKNTVFINGTKTKSSKRYVPISDKFAKILKNNFSNMFKFEHSYYSRTFQKYLKILGIENKTLHDLRHTFNSNLYYLGVNDKKRQYFMGHSSIVITNDIYTHLDLTVNQKDILNLYQDIYPKF